MGSRRSCPSRRISTQLGPSDSSCPLPPGRLGRADDNARVGRDFDRIADLYDRGRPALMPSHAAPGRVNLIGEHTDYAGGLALPLAIDRSVVVRGEAAGDAIHLRSELFRDTVEVSLDGQTASHGWGRRVAGVVAELAAMGRQPVGFDGVVAGDLPAGAGLGSSGAFGVAVARALCAVGRLELTSLEFVRACRRAEERATGVPCGLLDQAAAVLGRAGRALFLDCASIDHRLVALPNDLAVLVADSGVHRRVEETAYAERRRELEAGHRRRVRHVESENERVLAAVAALERDDRGALAEIFAAGQASLRDDYEVSIPELDRLVEEALAAGAFAARLTGAGFGGCIVALADADRAEAVLATLAARYRVFRAA
jgi:galactokinase